MNLLAHPLLMLFLITFSCGFAEMRPDFCNLEADSGRCMAYFPRFYFNQSDSKCEQFIYGGCEGNGNNFETIEDCQSTCG
ncbi:Kunitz-type serine protease inhibitor bitisilin-2 [Acropora cervicornis]|uniref:Kunitz-type serine protease inhibitor bitisilin-2 n=1 Tax=Acropora cervicornis TaxID=6130 RepID=A0AAD9VI52_ACRCE|nr:Kunitz-type serine protease inhibitor bitisilin-2 [Acropora cervicornis]